MHFERGFEFYWLDKHRILSQLPMKMITLLQFDVNLFGKFGFTILKKFVWTSADSCQIIDLIGMSFIVSL